MAEQLAGLGGFLERAGRPPTRSPPRREASS